MSTKTESRGAEQEPRATVSCSQCGRLNADTQKFCSDCGTRLREPCLRCGTLSLASEKFCGNCGENLVHSVERLIVQFVADLGRVKQLQADCRYDEAVSLLNPMREIEHSRLKQYVDQANQLAGELITERDRRIDQAKATYQETKELVAGREYESAVRLLEDVPTAVRSPEIEQLLGEAQARLDEIASLDEELSTAIACERTLHLLPKVSRLLTLKPGHVRAAELAERFRDRVARGAEEKLERHQYHDALELLGQLPESAWSPQLKSMRQDAAELVWLSEDLRTAPVVDSTLVHVAKCLGELSPGDARLSKLAAEVHRRAKLAAANPHRAYPPWASAPKNTRLGCPIDWLTGFQRIGIKEDLARPILADHPGCLLVAAGLALQGLQQAPLRLNLLPRESQSSLGRIAAALNRDFTLTGRGRPPHTAWGLDLSASGLKAVKLASKEKEEHVVVEDFDVVPHAKTIGEAFSDDEAKTLIEETLGTFCSRNSVKADRICLGLPTRTLLSRHFTVPRVDRKKLEKVVAHEARRHIPVPLEQVIWDYQPMAGGDGKPSKRQQEVVLVAARRPQLVDRLSAVQSAGLRVDVVQCDCLALYNFLAYDHFGCDGSDDGAASSDPGRSVALLDVGCDQMHLVVGSPGSVWFRSCRFGGEQFTRALTREFHLTAAQAEELKRRPQHAESLHRMFGALEPAFESLLEDARGMLDAFAADHETRRIERLLGCGGSFQLHGLFGYLRSGSC